MVVLRGLVLLVIAGLLLADAAERTGAADRVRLVISPWTGWAPALAGEAQGLWRELGIDAEVRVLSDDEQVRQALANGSADLSLAMIGNHVGSVLAGQDLVILGETNWSHGGDKVVIRRGVNAADLRGTTVGVYLNLPSVRYFLHRALVANHLSEADIRVEEVLDTGTLADAFIDGKYPLIVNFDPEALRSVREGDGRVLASSATFPGVIPEGFAMRRGRFSPELLERFFRGWFASVAWSRDPANWQTYAALMRAKAFTARTTEADLLTMVAAVRIHDPKVAMERNAPDGGLDTYLKELAEYLRSDGKSLATWDAKRVVDTTAFRAAAAGK